VQIRAHLKGELKIPTNFLEGSSLEFRSPLGYCRVYLGPNVVSHELAPVSIFPVRQCDHFNPRRWKKSLRILAVRVMAVLPFKFICQHQSVGYFSV
jgi:hypothetical protein